MTNLCRNIRCRTELPQDALYCPVCGWKQTIEHRRTKRANGAGTVYKLSDKTRSKPWVAAKSGEVIGCYESKAAAFAALDRIADKKISDRFNYTFAEMFSSWYNGYQLSASKSNLSQIKSSYNMCSSLHDKRFRSIRTDDLQAVITKLSETKKRGTLDHLVSLWTHLYKYAMREDIIDRNYAQFVVMPKPDAQHHQPFTPDEIERIKSDGSDASKIALMMIYTGMRVGEVLTLTASDYHGTYCVGGEKTKSGRNRYIPIPAQAKPLFDYFVSEAQKNNRDLLTIWQTRSFLTYQFPKLMERCGIVGKSSHSCRATFATNAAKYLDQDTLKRILGHSRFETTSDYYIHADLDTLIDAIKRIRY